MDWMIRSLASLTIGSTLELHTGENRLQPLDSSGLLASGLARDEISQSS